MIIIENINELEKNKEIIKKIKPTNYQQTYENIYSIHVSNPTAKTYISNQTFSTFIDKNENIIECALNIEPIVGINKSVLDFIVELHKYSNKTLYFPLVYENSRFYKLLKNKVYSYKRLYTSIIDLKKNNANILESIKNDELCYFPKRKTKKIEDELYIKYYKNIDVKDIISEVEFESWKHEARQDMISKKEQLIYYNELIKRGIAEIAVAYTKNNNDLVAYRIDALHNDKVYVLKHSYKEKYKKYSIGTYMLIYDLYKKYKSSEYIDLYGGPGQTKKIIENKRINRYDIIYGINHAAEELEKNRKAWDKKNYDIFLSGKSIREVFNKKENILVATSCFGLGPVGKLNTVIEECVDQYNWYAAGEKFDTGIFKENIFKDFCFSLDKNEIRTFVDKYNIKYAIVVLKNKMARILKEIGVRVLYIDSLPFMWSIKDAEEGKVPYDVDVYCAQKTLELSPTSKKIFSKVKNLIWINPIAKDVSVVSSKYNNYIIINLGGLHSPNTNGLDYVNTVIIPIIKKMKGNKILITTSTDSAIVLREHLKEYKNLEIENLKQEQFSNAVAEARMFLTSPGLTTILESSIVRDNVIFLPPQNISQFYNVEYGKKVFKQYKEITWNNNFLTLDNLLKIKNKNEQEIIMLINEEISIIKNNKDYLDYINDVLDEKYTLNTNCVRIKNNGAKQVIAEFKKLIKGDK